MKKLFGYLVIAFCVVSIMAGCSREIKEHKDSKESMEPKVSEVTYAVDAAIAESEKLVNTINDYVETYNYENIVEELEKVKDEITYWNEEIMDNGYIVMTLRDNMDNECIVTFDDMGILYSVRMY